MASVQMDGSTAKHVTKEACSRTIAHDFRLHEKYGNKDIDSSRTHLNQYFGLEQAPEDGAELDIKTRRKMGNEIREKFRKRIAECDAIHPPERYKSDRKTMLTMCIPAPREGMSDDELRAFFADVYADMEVCFGKENIMYGVSHFDEIHKYISVADKQKHDSRAGLHIGMVPFTDSQEWIPEKRKKGLNMNAFYKNSLPNMINKRLDVICNKHFGFDFQDHTKSSLGNVGDVKKQSEIIDQQNKEITIGLEDLNAQSEALLSVQKEAAKYQSEVDTLKAEKDTLSDEVIKLKATKKSKQEKMDEELEAYRKEQEEKARQAADEIMQQAQQKETDAKTLMNDARAKAKEQDEKGKKFQIWQDGLEAQKKVIDSEKAKLKADKEAFRDEKANEYAKIDERVAREIAIEKSKMKKSWIAHKEKWEAEKTAQNEKWLADTEEKLRKENQTVLDTALKEQVKDVKKYHEWQSRERAKQAADDIDFSGSKQKERSL